MFLHAIVINGTILHTLRVEFTHTYTGANGCDSILVLELNINPIQSIENSISISEGESYSVGNQTYSFSGTYIDTLQNIFSCDSIIITLP